MLHHRNYDKAWERHLKAMAERREAEIRRQPTMEVEEDNSWKSGELERHTRLLERVAGLLQQAIYARDMAAYEAAAQYVKDMFEGAEGPSEAARRDLVRNLGENFYFWSTRAAGLADDEEDVREAHHKDDEQYGFYEREIMSDFRGPQRLPAYVRHLKEAAAQQLPAAFQMQLEMELDILKRHLAAAEAEEAQAGLEPGVLRRLVASIFGSDFGRAMPARAVGFNASSVSDRLGKLGEEEKSYFDPQSRQTKTMTDEHVKAARGLLDTDEKCKEQWDRLTDCRWPDEASILREQLKVVEALLEGEDLVRGLAGHFIERCGDQHADVATMAGRMNTAQTAGRKSLFMDLDKPLEPLGETPVGSTTARGAPVVA